MRRVVGFVLMGVGAFFLTLSPSLRFYVADEVVLTPSDYYDKTVLRAENATYFDSAELQERQGVTVDATITSRGDVNASDDTNVVYDRFISVEDVTNKNQIQATQLRAVFDKKDAELVTMQKGTDPPAKIDQGVAFKFPFDTEKKDTTYYDYAAGKMVPIKFEREEKVEGRNAYKFVARIDPMPVQRPGSKPGEALELPGTLLNMGTKKLQPVQLYYSNTITIWVDPVTGKTLNQWQNVKQTLRTQDGQDRITAAQFDLKMIDKDVKKLAGLADDDNLRISWVKTLGPILSLVLGLILVGGGIALVATGEPGGGHRRRGNSGIV